MPVSLKDKVALITGGGTGLGKEISILLAKEGCHVGVNYSVSKDDAEQTVKELRALGVKSHAIQANVGIVAEAERVVDETVNLFGRIDILINNAGTTTVVPHADLESLTEEIWDKVLAVNTKAPFFTARAATRYFRKQGDGGHIINTSSIAGNVPSGSSIAYCSSKAAMSHQTRCLAKALGPDIKVNAVAPGFLATRWGLTLGDEAIKKLLNSAPLQRGTDVVDCAMAYIYLLTNDSVTGQVVVVDAGLTA